MLLLALYRCIPQSKRLPKKLSLLYKANGKKRENTFNEEDSLLFTDESKAGESSIQLPHALDRLESSQKRTDQAADNTSNSK